MVNIFNKWLSHPLYFRYGFFILLIGSVILNSFFLQNGSHFFILYIFSVLFLGIGFYNKSTWFLIFFTIIVVSCRFFLIPDATDNFLSFIIYILNYLLITFISVGLMKNVQKVKEDNLELTKALANALDSRDTYTLHHSENVARYAVEIAEKMKLSKDLCNIIHIGGLLHDIGKIGIPENILTKPGKLTNDEYELIKTHPKIGYDIIKHVESFHNNGVLDIVLYHHERFDGKGYPTGLQGNQIPLVARIVAVADTFDAMTSKRVYREKELDIEYTLNEIRKNKSTQFDPEVVDVFLSLFDKDK
ncbi:HD-GYP domain-containing protein [Psychrobacillus sp. PGGUH221]|uniref:HD-GYP domain-containing protein n=1 Tax=Psychrobacillus sp. PGGUH221 TaxID=3020058 RepID=UPI0035C68D70